MPADRKRVAWTTSGGLSFLNAQLPVIRFGSRLQIEFPVRAFREDAFAPSDRGRVA